jgi:hypothetical protein
MNTLGAVLYRAGRHREAIAKLDKGMALSKAYFGTAGSVEDWIFLGLAHHAIGETDEAKKWLEKVRAAPKEEGPFSWQRVEVELLRAELEAALAPPPGDKK